MTDGGCLATGSPRVFRGGSVLQAPKGLDAVRGNP